MDTFFKLYWDKNEMYSHSSANITRFQDASVVGETSGLKVNDPPEADYFGTDSLTMMNGHASPGPQSMKEYSEVISQLKKENFRLKLRIFYMEEKVQNQLSGDQEQLFKTNIELKVECDSLRKELQDKNDLLLKATNAVASFGYNQDDVDQLRREAEREIQELNDALQQKNQNQQRDLLLAQEETENLSKIVGELQEKLKESREENDRLHEKINEATKPQTPAKEDAAVFSDFEDDDVPETPSTSNFFKEEEMKQLQAESEQKQRTIEQLIESLETKQNIIEVLTEEKQNNNPATKEANELKKQLDEKQTQIEKLQKIHQHTEEKNKQFMDLQGEYQDHISEQQQRLDDYELAIRQMSEQLEKRENEVKDLKLALEECEAALKESKDLAEEMMDKLEAKEDEDNAAKSKEIIMRDKAINGFTSVIRQKDEEIEELKEQQEKHLMVISEMNKLMEKKQKEKPVNKAKDELIIELQDQLKQQNDALQLALDDKLKSVNDADNKLRHAQNLCKDFERQNKTLIGKLENNEELVKKLDSEIKEKDVQLQEALNKYKLLQLLQEEQEKARLKVMQERDDLRDKFEEEKRHFAELTKKLQDQLKNQDGESSLKLASEHAAHTIEILNKRIKDLELQLANKNNKIEELMKQLANLEQEKQLALDELEAAVSQREEEEHRDSGSRNRISALKSAEVERLRNLLREKDNTIEDLEEKILLLEGQLEDTKNQLSIAQRKIALWQDECKRKESAIQELREALEELSQHPRSPDHHQIIKLTKENVELKQLLKARDSEIEFLKAEAEASKGLLSGDPYIESLKREINRKEKLLEDARSRLGAGSASLHSELDSVTKELEDHKMELQNIQHTIDSLNQELEQKNNWLSKLQDNEKAKDQLIKDLRLANSRGKIPTVESDEESLSSHYSNSDANGRKKHRKRKMVKQESLQNTASQTSVRYTCSSQNTNYTETDLQFTESDLESGRQSAEQRTIESLKDEVENLREEINRLVAENTESEDVLQRLASLDEEREHIANLEEMLHREIQIYKNLAEIERGKENLSTDEDLWRLTESMEHQLVEIKDLRQHLHDLLLLVKENSEEIVPTQDNYQSLSSTLLPHNQTSYLGMPVSSPNHSQNHNEQNQISELQTMLDKTRTQLSDAVREQADLHKALEDSEEMRKNKEEENIRLQEELRQSEKDRVMNAHEYTTLRAEVDRMRSEQEKIHNNRQLSDDNASLRSGDESDGMSSLSRRELREVINNQRKKLANAEKVNELLKHQLKTATQQRNNNTTDQTTIHKLTEEVTRLKTELNIARQQSSSKNNSKIPSKSKSVSALKSKLPVPVDKNHPAEDKDTVLRRALDRSRASMTELRNRNKELQERLTATEETVRSQTEKLKRCQSALAAAGIASPPLSPIRGSRSQPNLSEFSRHFGSRDQENRDQVDSSSNETADAFTQTSADDSGYLSVSPRTEQRFNSLIQAQSKELSVFRQQLKKSRATSKHLQTQLDIISRYMDTLLSSSGDSIDTMLANGVTTELDRCRKLTKRLRDQLAERNADTSMSDSDSDSMWRQSTSPLAMRRQSVQWQKMVKDLENKEKHIEELECQLKNLQVDQEANFEDRYFKKEKMEPPRDLLTPSTSQHSLMSESEGEPHCDISRPVTGTGTEYQSLPDNYMRQTWPQDNSTPTPHRVPPMYQRTIAVTEYLPDRPRSDSYGSRHQYPASNERFQTSYGGAWSGSPRAMNTRGSQHDDYNRYGNRTPTNQQRYMSPASYHSDASKDAEINELRHRLNESDRLNRSLREEMNITLLHRNQETNTSFSSGYNTSRNPADVLDEHLREIRSLRQRLEASIETNDRLREQLQRKLNEVGKQQSPENVSIFLPPDSQDNLLQENRDLREKLRRKNDEVKQLQDELQNEKDAQNNKHSEALNDLSEAQRELAEKQSQTELLAAHINKLTNDLQQANSLANSLNTQVKVKEAALSQLQDDIKEYKKQQEEEEKNKDLLQRLDSKCGNLEEQLKESDQLVDTLKSELNLYEKLHKSNSAQTENVSQDPDSLDLSEFLSEIRSLRGQLEQSIDANAALRRQLEEQLKRDGRLSNSASPARTTTINIHHMSPRDDMDKSMSPRSNAKRKLKLAENHNNQSVLMTPPPSAHSQCDEHPGSQNGFNFGSDYDDSRANSPRRSQKLFFNFNGPYVIGKYTDYAVLKQKLSDGRLIVRGLDTKVKNSKSVFRQEQSPRNRNLKDIEGSVLLLSQLLDDSSQVLRAFWPADLPTAPSPSSKRSSRLSEVSDLSKGTKDAGFGSDSSVNSDADMLRREVGKLRKRLSAQDHLLQSTVDRLQNANKMKEGIEHAILKQLTVTHDVLKKARGNLEAKALGGSHMQR